MLSPSATRSLVSRLRNTSTTDRTTTAADRLTVLTERELEVAVCVGRGLSNSEIASELYLSIPTVKSHVSRLLTKLGATNRVQVAMVVHDAGLV
jgi:DNA-binding NarL/FixJ family response regulator